MTVTDQNGCSNDTIVEVLQPDGISLTSSTDSATCGNADGMAIITASGGSVTVDYFYSWEDNNGVDLNTNNDSLIGVASSSYTVFVSDDNSCMDSLLITVPEIGGPAVTDSVIDITCYGDTSGIIYISTLGADPFTYSWSGPIGFTDPGDTSIIYNLDTGLYNVTVTDFNNCNTILDSIRVSEPNSPLTIDTTIKTLTCHNDASGSIDISVNNGTSPFTYSWSGINGFTSSSQNISGLEAGIYVLNVTDSNNCKIINDSITVLQPDSIVISETLISPTCNSSDGSIIVSVTGGSVANDYSYNWDDLTSGNLGVGSDDTLSNIGPGSYQISVQDDSLCTGASVITINNENGPVVQDSVINITCTGDSDGAIYLTVSNLSGVEYGVDWDIDGLIGSGDSDGPDSDTLLNLSAGLYTVYVTDSTTGCVTIKDTIVLDPGIIVLTPSTDSVSCNGFLDGSVSVLATGGNAGYNYQWDLAAGGQITDTAINLGIGTYSVTVTDQKGCSSDTTVTLEQPDVLTIISTWTDSVSCNGLLDGSATAQASGGNGNYTYSWDLFAGGQVSDTATNLGIGTYSLTITDSKGCSEITTVTVEQPDILVIDTTFQDSVSCNGLLDGYAAIGNISGGNGGLTYSWDATAGSQTTDTATNLAAGTYIVTVTDAKGCSKDTTVSVLQPDSLLIIITSQDSVSCSGLADGSASVDSISGGNGNFSYLWDATANNQTTALASNLAIGTYRVLVSDINNCIDSADVTVFEPSALTIYTSNDSVSCNGLSDGSAIVDSVTGGNGVYFYLWDANANNQTTDTASSLISGTYLVTVTDQNGCSLDSSVTVSQPDSLIVDTLSVVNPYCSSSNDGSITLNINGGTQPISSNWTNILGTYSSIDQDIDSLFVGSYIINISDYNGCNSTDTITLTPNVEIIVNAGNDTLVCFGDSLTLFGASTGTTNPTLSWDIFNPITSTDSSISTGSSQVNISSFTQDSAQIYSFIYTVEEQSCTVKDSVLVTVVSLPIVDAGLDVTLGYNDPHILGGNPTGPSGASYSWTPITNFTFESDSILENPGIDVLSSVTYTVFVTDTNGCISSDQVVVSLIPNIIVPSGFSPNGDGINDTWEIQNLEAFENTTVRVYNRWGTLVYDYDESNENWTGGGSSNEMIPVGTYYFIIEFDNYDGERGNITGPITIIR